MEIWHRITFSKYDQVDNELDRLAIRYKVSPLPGDYYLLHFDIEESDPRWPEIEELVKAKDAMNFYDTFFSEEEIRSAEWVRMIPAFEQGYPQPEKDWVTNPINYEGECHTCGAGFRQVVPFRISKEPRMKGNAFVRLYWTSAVFCIYEVFQKLEAEGVRGYQVWDVVLHRTNEVSQVVKQLVVNEVTKPGLLEEESLRSTRCSECGITKFEYHKRGYMRYRRDSLPREVDMVETFEWFGSGRMALREILVSNRVACLILDNKWKGVDLKPVMRE